MGRRRAEALHVRAERDLIGRRAMRPTATFELIKASAVHEQRGSAKQEFNTMTAAAPMT
jgi:hypothetical protein